MKINAKLLPMKLHYFFLFGGTAPLLPYLPVYINQNLHISYKGVGFIYTLLPFFGLIVKAASGALSDWLHIHRTVFLSSIVLCGTSFFCIFFTPPMPYHPNTESGHIQFDCSAPSSYLRHSLHGQKCWDGFKKNGTTTCELNCESDLISTREMCQLWNVPPSQCSENGLNFTSYSYLDKVVEDQIEMFLPVSNLTIMSTEVVNPILSPSHSTNCSVKCDMRGDDLYRRSEQDFHLQVQ
ncbi:UNVERIFIED_CONTAM: hypothetical protein GTU68_030258 [Idotea baltica]|nr:hypothetical protein [Idotea baltica]